MLVVPDQDLYPDGESEQRLPVAFSLLASDGYDLKSERDAYGYPNAHTRFVFSRLENQPLQNNYEESLNNEGLDYEVTSEVSYEPEPDPEP